VRDFGVQEFFRELIVGVATLSDLAGLVLVEIFHRGEDGNVEQVDQTSKQFSCVCNFLSLPLSLVFIYLTYLYCLYLYMLEITHA